MILFVKSSIQKYKLYSKADNNIKICLKKEKDIK